MLRAIAFALLLLAVCAGTVPPAQASERIVLFHGAVEVQPDASLVVTEDLRVQVEGREIKRGILRDFPTTYRDRFGGTINVGFEVLEVRRNGRPEPYRVENLSNGKRVRIGDADVFLPHGLQDYRIVYRTTRQLGFFADFDELYWNVTGNGWTFPIDAAEAEITLPPGATVTQSSAYTGSQGAQGRAFTVEQPRDGRILFRTTEGLAPGDGLTIAVAWPKGFVTPPTSSQHAAWLFADNRLVALAVIGLLLILGYYLVMWWRVGRDPEAGTIIPLFAAPDGLSPAAIGFVSRMGFRDQAFAAAIVDMAVKGHLHIEEDDGFTLQQVDDKADGLSPGEAALSQALFERRQSVELKQKNHQVVGAARKALRTALRDEYDGTMFIGNRLWFVVGAGLSLLVLGACLLFGQPSNEIAFLSVWLSIWSIGCLTLLWRALSRWQVALTTGRGLGAAFVITVFCVPFLGAQGFVMSTLGSAGAYPFFAVAAIIGAVNLLFFYLLKAPTKAGRALLDKIEGFKRYLTVAEQDRLEVLHPPERTPALFERFLPYAIALGVEHQWSAQFAGVLDNAATAYQPAWYSGGGFHGLGGPNLGSALADGLGSGLTSAVSAASTAPGSSSGSGGGGSSGGGGGGGGGSGW